MRGLEGVNGMHTPHVQTSVIFVECVWQYEASFHSGRLALSLGAVDVDESWTSSLATPARTTPRTRGTMVTGLQPETQRCALA